MLHRCTPRSRPGSPGRDPLARSSELTTGKTGSELLDAVRLKQPSIASRSEAAARESRPAVAR